MSHTYEKNDLVKLKLDQIVKDTWLKCKYCNRWPCCEEQRKSVNNGIPYKHAIYS